MSKSYEGPCPKCGDTHRHKGVPINSVECTLSLLPEPSPALEGAAAIAPWTVEDHAAAVMSETGLARAACAVADAWTALGHLGKSRVLEMFAPLHRELHALETATRGSPLRKPAPEGAAVTDECQVCGAAPKWRCICRKYEDRGHWVPAETLALVELATALGVQLNPAESNAAVAEMREDLRDAKGYLR